MKTVNLSKSLLYWLLVLPVSSILLLEITLQTGSFINQHFFTNNHQEQWLTSHLRIVTMGDSNTYGLYLDSKDSYPKQLETLWNASHKNQQIEVINLGYPGANSSRIVANIEEVVDTLHPDFIMVMIGTNDSWTLPITGAENSLTDQPWNIFQWVKSHSKIYRAYCLITREPIDENELKTVTTSDPKQKESAKDKPATIDYKNLHLDYSMTMRSQNDIFNPDENIQKNFGKLMSYAEKSKQRIIFLTYAANKGYYKQANKMTKEAVSKNQYQDFIDISAAFAELQTPKGEGNEYFFPDLHATAKGNHLVAETAMQNLEAILQLNQPKATQ
ncbi:MAG TPA: SGNH/GDSL hydrolase family protein [Pseudomonadales bacterium]|nr:SGNH/GDSL hydrolase family protein [Pseudomonadales bacterium]